MNTMKRLMSPFVMVSVVLLTAGTVQAADFMNFGGDGLWTTATNWSDNLVPNNSDVRIGNTTLTDQTVTIASGVNATASRVRLGEDGNAGMLIIDGGSLSTGVAALTTDDVRVGANSSSSGILNLLSGSMTVGKDLEIGQQGAGTFTMTTGTVIVGDDIVLGTAFAGVFNLNGGTVTQTATYEGNGDLTMGANGLLNFGGTGGTLVLWGNQVNDVNTYFGNGWITSDLGGIAVDNTTDPAFTVVTAAIPEPATLGLIAAFGGGLLFLRRRFAI